MERYNVIDNSVVKERDIGINPVFSINDIGKLKCIVLKEKSMASWSNSRIHLHSIKLTNQNANLVLPKDFDFAISTSNDSQEVKTFYDLADERNFFYIAGGAAIGWTSSFGIYTDLYRQKTQGFLNDSTHIRQDSCMSGTALTSAGMITSIALSVLLGNQPKQSARFEMSMKDFTTVPLYEGVNPFADELYKKPN
ncbi:MAG: hypothetical protein LBG19_02020 [Prevotellaceae bacterium]|nr:hypothetical protein [Prevotellaceae bacterium]